MLKVRLMGTKNDITWFKKIMQRHPKIEVLELSDLYPNKGSRTVISAATTRNAPMTVRRTLSAPTS